MSGFKKFLFLLAISCLFLVSFSSPVFLYLPSGDPNVNVSDVNNTYYCILANLNIKLNLHYNTSGKKAVEIDYDVPKSANGTGICLDELLVTYRWPDNDDPNVNKNFVIIKWGRKDDSVYIQEIGIKIFANSLPDPTNPENIQFTATSLKLLQANYNDSLECRSGETARDDFEESENSVSISGVYQIGELDDPVFTEGDQCLNDKEIDGGSTAESSSKSNVGAIAGGVVAALIVLICIAAFGLHFYRRNKRHSSN